MRICVCVFARALAIHLSVLNLFERQLLRVGRIFRIFAQVNFRHRGSGHHLHRARLVSCFVALLVPSRFDAHRLGLVVVGPKLRWQPIAQLRWQLEPADAKQADAHIIQTSSVAHDEIVFCHQSKSRCQGLEAVVAENGSLKACTSGERRSPNSLHLVIRGSGSCT